MSLYKKELQNFTTPFALYIPTYNKINGKESKVWPNTSELIYFGSWKSYGGTESIVDGTFKITDTAVITTFFDPQIKSNCKILLLDHNEFYEIIGQVENIDQRNQYCKFKVQRIKNGA